MAEINYKSLELKFCTFVYEILHKKKFKYFFICKSNKYFLLSRYTLRFIKFILHAITSFSNKSTLNLWLSLKGNKTF